MLTLITIITEQIRLTELFIFSDLSSSRFVICLVLPTGPLFLWIELPIYSILKFSEYFTKKFKFLTRRRISSTVLKRPLWARFARGGIDSKTKTEPMIPLANISLHRCIVNSVNSELIFSNFESASHIYEPRYMWRLLISSGIINHCSNNALRYFLIQ